MKTLFEVLSAFGVLLGGFLLTKMDGVLTDVVELKTKVSRANMCEAKIEKLEGTILDNKNKVVVLEQRHGETRRRVIKLERRGN